MRTHLDAKVDITGLEELKNRIKNLKMAKIDYGFINGEHSKANMSYATLATILEFGTVDIPARPAFSASINKLESGRSSFKIVIKKPLGDYIEGEIKDVDHVLDRTGRFLKGTYQDSMFYWVSEGTVAKNNRPFTQSAKGFNQPFVETEELIDNVEYHKRK